MELLFEVAWRSGKRVDAGSVFIDLTLSPIGRTSPNLVLFHSLNGSLTAILDTVDNPLGTVIS